MLRSAATLTFLWCAAVAMAAPLVTSGHAGPHISNKPFDPVQAPQAEPLGSFEEAQPDCHRRLLARHAAGTISAAELAEQLAPC